MKIIDYRIYGHWDNEKLQDKVQRAMAEGWQPLGGVSVTATVRPNSIDDDVYRTHYYQAMVRYEPERIDLDITKECLDQLKAKEA